MDWISDDIMELLLISVENCVSPLVKKSKF